MSDFVNFINNNWMYIVGAVALIAIVVTLICLRKKPAKTNEVKEEVSEAKKEEIVEVNEDKEEVKAEVNEEINEQKPVKTVPAKATEEKTTEKKTTEKKSPKKTVEKKATEKKSTKKDEKVEKKEEVENEDKPAIEDNDVYEVKYDNSTREWYVKKVGGTRANKRFFTKSEAMNFANELVEGTNAKVVAYTKEGKSSK